MKSGNFIILGRYNNGLQHEESCLVKITETRTAEHFSFPKAYVDPYLLNRKTYGDCLLNRAFRSANSKPITLTDPEFIHIIETHTLVPELLPEFAKFMRNILVEQFGDKLLVKPKVQPEYDPAGVSVKDATEQLEFIRFNV